MSNSNQASPNKVEAPLSIGGLSRATGVAVETLRTWERRYGFPAPVRTPSGHRRYTLETAERLRRVQAAIARGHRASAVLTCSEAQLEALLSMNDGAAAPVATSLPAQAPVTPEPVAPPVRAPAGGGHDIPRLLEIIRRFDGQGLDQALEHAWQRLGAQAFVCSLAVELLQEIGERWSRGDVSIAHEHFTSERLRDFLSRQWRPLTTRATGPHIICAALSGEYHSLALHLSAVLLALEGARPVILGADTPEREVARAATSFSADAVLVSTSRAANSDLLYDQLTRLREALPSHMTIAVGGAAGGLPPRIERLQRLDAISEWVHRLSR